MTESHWDNDKQFPVEDWRYEVANNDTRLGYLEWLKHMRQQAAEDADFVGYDFTMDSFVSVQAPKGTDPDTLTAAALSLFRERLANNELIVTFDGIFDDETGFREDAK
jgi:hypothetical protein